MNIHAGDVKPIFRFKFLSKLLSRMPLWTVLIVPFVVIIVTVVGLTNYLTHRNSQMIVHNIVSQLLDETNASIEIHLNAFFNEPILINELNAILMQHGVLDTSNPDALAHYFWQQVQEYNTVTSIYFGNSNGGLVVGGREGEGESYYIMSTDNFASGDLHKYATDTQGNLDDLLFTVPQFDARIRPWYMGAVENGSANWTDPYLLSTGQDLAIASSLPVYDDTGNLIGVVSVDLFLSHIGAYLESLEIGHTGQAYLVDHSGLIVSTSTDASLFNRSDDNTWQRITALESDDPIIAATANYIVNTYGGFDAFDTPQHRAFNLNGENQHLLVTPFHSFSGIDWFIVLSVPHSDFLDSVQEQTSLSIIIMIVAVVLAILVGVLVTWLVIRPITTLSRAVKVITRGDWSHRVPTEGVREIRALGHAFNSMAKELQSSFTHLEERIQERTLELKTSEARYRAVVEDQTELICRFKMDDYKLTFVNGAYCRYFGKTERELIGKGFLPMIPDDDQQELMQQLQTLSPEKPTLLTEHRTIRHDGQIRWMQWSNHLLVNDDKKYREVQAVGRDVTEKRQFQETLQKALDRETELNQLKSKFISMVSHEFRTPMTIIQNSSQIIQRYGEKLGDEKRELHHERIREQIERMTNLLEDVLTISRNNMRQFDSTPVVLDIATLCETIIHDVLSGASHDVTIKLHREGDCQESLVDETLLRLIFTNLISNAVKYSPAGREVNVTLGCSDKYINFSVKDEGIGIPPEAHERIFELFYRADNVDNIQGTGLGLAIVKQSVEQCGGNISFESEANVGTTFSVTLPTMNSQIDEALSNLEA